MALVRCPTILAAALVWLASAADAPAQEQARFCNAEAANVLLYLDVTTPYDDIDKNVLIDGFGRIFDGLAGGERIAIRTIEDEFSRSRRLLEACIPFCASTGFLGDLFSTCTEGVAINERRLLTRTIVDRLSSLLASARELDQSEIIRTLTESLKEEYREKRPNRIFIYSDMIENSSYLSGKDFFAAGDGAVIERLEHDNLIPEIWDADVRVFGIGRIGIPGNRTVLTQDRLQKLTAFWTKFFAAGGARLQMHQNLSMEK